MGIVDGSNWGTILLVLLPAELFVLATVGALDINQASLKDLKRMAGIEDEKAASIMEERRKRAFDSYEDAIHQLDGVDKTVLKRFKISARA